MSDKEKNQKTDIKAKENKEEDLTGEDASLSSFLNKIIFLILGGFLIYYIAFWVRPVIQQLDHDNRLFF